MPNSKNWESGTVVIPENEWNNLKQHLIKTHNDFIDYAYKTAMKVYEDMNSKLISSNLFEYVNYKLDKYFNEADHAIFYFTAKSFFEKDVDDWCIKTHIIKPKKEEFEALKIDLNAKNFDFNTGELNISFHDKNRFMGWYIRDNIPNSVIVGRKSYIGKSCINYLNSIVWKKDTGGFIQLCNFSNCDIEPLVFGERGHRLQKEEEYLPKLILDT